MNGTWYEDKLRRSIDFYRTFCIQACTCAACSGSGVYDDHGSPACGACDGTGRTRDTPRTPTEATELMNDAARRESIRLRRVREKREAKGPAAAHALSTAR
jgi:hypothetical protein